MGTPSLRLAVNYQINTEDVLTKRLEELLKNDKVREEADKRLNHIHNQRKAQIDQGWKLHVFVMGDLFCGARRSQRYGKGS